MNQFNIFSTFDNIHNAIYKSNRADLHPLFSSIVNKISSLTYNNLVDVNTRLNNIIAYYDNRHRLAHLNGMPFDILSQNELNDMIGCVTTLLNEISATIDAMYDYQNNYVNYLVNNINNVHINNGHMND